jgi:hypothetical protein
MAADDDALKIINDFAEMTTFKGMWPNIARADLVTDLKARLADKNGLNQNNANICGPTVFVHMLLSDNPAAWAQMVTQLYDLGSSVFKGMALKPCWDLLHSQLPPAFNRADWILLASIRDSYNWFLDYYRDSGLTPDGKSRGDDDSSGGTTPGELIKWLKAMGYTVEDGTSFGFFAASEDNARKANELLAKERRVALLISARMLLTKEEDNESPDEWGWFSKPDHVVQLTTPIQLSEEDVNFTVFTWGSGTYQVPKKYPEKKLSLKNFLGNYFGYIAAKF